MKHLAARARDNKIKKVRLIPEQRVLSNRQGVQLRKAFVILVLTVQMVVLCICRLIRA